MVSVRCLVRKTKEICEDMYKICPMIPMKETSHMWKMKSPSTDCETPPISCDLHFHDGDQCHKDNNFIMLPLT